MKNITVTKVQPVGQNPYFKVSLNDQLVQLFSFMYNVSEDNIYNEAKNYAAAIQLAKILEGPDKAKDEVVYQSVIN